MLQAAELDTLSCNRGRLEKYSGRRERGCLNRCYCRLEGTWEPDLRLLGVGCGRLYSLYLSYRVWGLGVSTLGKSLA